MGWLGLAGIVAISFLMSFHTLIDNDIFWHLQTGQIIFETHRVPRQDLYSFTKQGAEWIDAQWLFQLIIYRLYREFGYAGMIAWFSLLTALTWVLILGLGFRPQKYFFLILAALPALLTVFIRLKPRPEILTFFYLALEFFLIHRGRQGGKFALYFLPPLILIWMNSEGLWPVGLVVLLAYWFEEIWFWPRLGLSRRLGLIAPARTRGMAVPLIWCILISSGLVFLNPYGWRGVLFPWTLFKEVSFLESFLGQAVNEFRNPFTSLPPIVRCAYISLILLSALFFAALLRKRRFYPAAMLLWIGFLASSISALRNVALFALVTVAAVGSILNEEPDREIFPFAGLRARFEKLRGFGAIALLLLMALLAVDLARSKFFIRNNFFIRFGTGVMETQYPLRACRFLKEITPELNRPEGLKIFDDLGSAGSLIWAGYPEWKVYVDPRLEVYGDKFYEHYASLFEDPAAFAREDDLYGFDAVVLSELMKYQDFIRALYTSPDWCLVYLDGQSIIFLKRPGPQNPDPELAAALAKYQIDFQKPFSSPLPAGVGGVWLAQEKYVLGFLLNYVMGRSELAARELAESVRLNPEDLNANWFLGHILFSLDRYQEARPALEFTARKNPDFLKGRIELGRDYAMLGELDRALAEYDAILKRGPGAIQACMDRAGIYERMKSERAYGAWKECERIYQSDPELYREARPRIEEALSRLGPGR